MRLLGTSLHPGQGTGPLLVLDEPLSLWGGTDVATGAIVEPRHPQHSLSMAGRVIAFPSVRGSSSSATVFAEQIRRGVGPSAVLLGERDTILVLGALVAAELYDQHVPVVLLRPADFDLLPRRGEAAVDGRAASVVIMG